MKEERRNGLESDWIDEDDKEEKASLQSQELPMKIPWVYLPFVKGTSEEERMNENILDRVRLVVSPNEYFSVVNVLRLGRSIH